MKKFKKGLTLLVVCCALILSLSTITRADNIIDSQYSSGTHNSVGYGSLSWTHSSTYAYRLGSYYFAANSASVNLSKYKGTFYIKDCYEYGSNAHLRLTYSTGATSDVHKY